jgi:hypothetical protein
MLFSLHREGNMNKEELENDIKITEEELNAYRSVSKNFLLLSELQDVTKEKKKYYYKEYLIYLAKIKECSLVLKKLKEKRKEFKNGI